jgi:SAM-dependent methyltransferase
MTELSTQPLTVADYGANDGKMLRCALESGLSIEGYGVDANDAAIARGRMALEHGLQLRLGGVTEYEAFARDAGGFDVVCLMGVLEHVLDQVSLLERLRISLRPGGTFIVSVPGRHFLSWLDFGNWKFRFPRVHRFFVEKTKGRPYYHERFLECRNGLFGDIEVGKEEHQHFSRRELQVILENNGFDVEYVDGYGTWFRLLHNVWWFSPGLVRKMMHGIIHGDLRRGTSVELVACAHSRT